MNILNSKLFFNQTIATGTSEVLGNIRGDLLVIEVYGTATAIDLKVQGVVDANNITFSDISWKKSDGTTGTNIVAEGVYIINVSGLSKIQVVVDTITGGNITVFGKLGE